MIEIVLWLVLTHPDEEWRWIEARRWDARTFTIAECSEKAWSLRSLAPAELAIPQGWGHTAACLTEPSRKGLVRGVPLE